MKVASVALLGLATIGMWAQEDPGNSAAKPEKAAAPETHHLLRPRRRQIMLLVPTIRFASQCGTNRT
jgi:hypothetical protein